MVAARPLSGGPTAELADGAAPPAPAPRRTAELTSRERRERALLAMCIALPERGQGLPGPPHRRAPLARSALAPPPWLREHPEDPASNLPRDDAELAGLIAELVILAHDEPASPEAMELNFLLLEQRRLEAEIAAAGEAERLRAPRRPQPRARRPGRAHRPHRAGRGLIGKFLTVVPG